MGDSGEDTPEVRLRTSGRKGVMMPRRRDEVDMLEVVEARCGAE